MLTRSFTNCKYFNKSLELRLYLLLYVGCSRRITEYRWKEKEKQRRVLSVWSKYTENNLISSAVILIWTELSTGKKDQHLIYTSQLELHQYQFYGQQQQQQHTFVTAKAMRFLWSIILLYFTSSSTLLSDWWPTRLYLLLHKKYIDRLIESSWCATDKLD